MGAFRRGRGASFKLRQHKLPVGGGGRWTRWFDGFAGRPPARTDAAPVARAKTWLLTAGWRLRAGGGLRPGETPAPPRLLE